MNRLSNTASAIRGNFRQQGLPRGQVDRAFEEMWDAITSGTHPYPKADWVRFIQANSDSRWHFTRLLAAVKRGYHPQTHL